MSPYTREREVMFTLETMMGEFIAQGTIRQNYIGPADSQTTVALHIHPQMKAPMAQLINTLRRRRRRIDHPVTLMRLRIDWPPDFPSVQTEGGTR